jgi:hypothetical protein
MESRARTCCSGSVPRRHVVIGLLVLVACFPIRDLGCECGTHHLSAEDVARIAADEAKAKELMAGWIAAHGGTLRVRDDALGTDWVAVAAGIEGFQLGLVTIRDEPMAVHAKLKAQRADRSVLRPREIEVGFTFMPGANGLEVVATSLRGVGPDPSEGGPTEDRHYFACPVGTAHFAAFAAGESPCHHVPLVPLYRCGCDEPGDKTDPAECAQYQRTPELKTVCRKDRGEPQPK